MIVRTYGRRNRGIPRTYSDTLDDVVQDDSFRDSLSQEDSHSQDQLYGLNFSSQDSASHWSTFESDPYGLDSSQSSLPELPTKVSLDDSSLNGVGRKSKKPRIGKRGLEVPKNSRPLIPTTSTLMEAQEFGEMMEHVDEVNFALDGLRRNQPVRIRRASLLSLLSICATAQQRRLLRTQGMAKTIVDSILGLSLEDSPSNVAAAALFYVLTNDGQDEHLLESPSCVRFLIRLLKPIVSAATEDKVPKIGCKLLALRTGADIVQNTTKKVDSSSAAIFSKVDEILVSCKEIKPSCGDDTGIVRPELCPKWISLLTMEKACLSTISLEETSGTIRKTGGNFKEKLRELGGLDAVFEVAMNCHSDMEGCMEGSSPSMQDTKVAKGMQSLTLLLKCLKIMENATFLSKDNQSHLLGMKRNLDALGTPLSFTELVLSGIKILSALYLVKNSSDASNNEKYINLSDSTDDASELALALVADCKVENNETLFANSSKSCWSSEKFSAEKSSSLCQNSQLGSTEQLEYSRSTSLTTSNSMADACSLRTRLNSSTSGSCSGTPNLIGGIRAINNGSRNNTDLGQRYYIPEDVKLELLVDTQDPFAFDEDEFELSKWDILSGKDKSYRTQKSGLTCRELEDGCLSHVTVRQQESSNGETKSRMIISQQESSNGENHNMLEASCPIANNEEGSSLLSDCLLTAVKVLMNLTNDNPVGCRQIADSGGLEIMTSLIVGHFPSFSTSSSLFSDIKENTLLSKIDHQNDRHLTDQELDFLVAILGLLVNLIEKDSQNRSRLAASSVHLSGSEGFEEESRKDVIPLLCSIFLANQGEGEGGEEGKVLQWNDEAAMLQGEKEAEKMIVEAYAALLLAFLSTESKRIRNTIADYLPDRNLAVLVPVLERFVAFHLTLNMISPETHKAVSEVIESCLLFASFGAEMLVYEIDKK
ncbi:hypothetical protein FNV43_RR07603 [Rhamnella rubrinervis]|uniref:WAPL domain-containing protein n=1 Tax=Rhamnella rubrinervis TaxID=2594499 RepID=A0A8K0MMW2_9ROSA|nr:hypothetical protein FNV43_RR07603 [Rhamnella rubrinervis]